VGPPIYPCYKGEGLCNLRTMDTDKFECVFKAGACSHRKVSKVKSKEDETPELWDTLGRGKES